MPRLPAVFVSHGAPSLVIEDTPARAFLSGLGRALGRPDAVIVLSAHWTTDRPSVGSAPVPATIHDFYGFPQELYRLRYPAPGAPGLAGEIAGRLGATLDPARGLDHGAWAPLSLMYPEADIPVVPVSIQPERDPAHHLRLGEALRLFRDRNVLVLATGAMTHNLRAYTARRPGEAVPDWVTGFTDWVVAAVAKGDTAALLDFQRSAPDAAANHPTIEHLLPLFAALGAGTPGLSGRRLHAGVEHGVIAMDAYAFE